MQSCKNRHGASAEGAVQQKRADMRSDEMNVSSGLNRLSAFTHGALHENSVNLSETGSD